MPTPLFTAGGSAGTYPADGSDCPSSSSPGYWEVRDPSGTVVAYAPAPVFTPTAAPPSAAGWLVDFGGAPPAFDMTAPASAGGGAGYQARAKTSGGACISMIFDVAGATPATPARRRSVCG